MTNLQEKARAFIDAWDKEHEGDDETDEAIMFARFAAEAIADERARAAEAYIALPLVAPPIETDEATRDVLLGMLVDELPVMDGYDRDRTARGQLAVILTNFDLRLKHEAPDNEPTEPTPT